MFKINRIICRRYHKNIIDHYENPRNVGKLNSLKKNVGTGLVGAPACGDVMKLQIKCEDQDGVKRIVDAKFKTYGCGSAIASSGQLIDMLKGKTIDEAKEICNKEIVDILELPPIKIHCSVLAEEAIKKAIIDFEDNDSHRKHNQ